MKGSMDPVEQEVIERLDAHMRCSRGAEVREMCRFLAQHPAGHGPANFWEIAGYLLYIRLRHLFEIERVDKLDARYRELEAELVAASRASQK